METNLIVETTEVFPYCYCWQNLCSNSYKLLYFWSCLTRISVWLQSSNMHFWCDFLSFTWLPPMWTRLLIQWIALPSGLCYVKLGVHGRWSTLWSYFYDNLSRDSTLDNDILYQIPQTPFKEQLSADHSNAEVIEAVWQTEINKAGGPSGKPVEVCIAGDPILTHKLLVLSHDVHCLFWQCHREKTV